MKNKHNAKRIKIISTSALAISLVAGSAFLLIPSSSAISPVINQGSSSSFGVLAATGITNTGTTALTGTAGNSIGSSPTDTITGAPSGTVQAVGVAATAQSALITAYEQVAAQTGGTTVSALEDQTLTSGVYSSASSIGITGTLTLSGTASDVFIFQMGSTLTTANSSHVVLSGGAQACNVYWQVGSSATLGTTSTLVGHVYALTSISATTGAIVYGQLLARNGAVTLDTNQIINDNCSTPVVTSSGNYNPVTVPAIAQSSYVTSVESENCTTTADYTVNLAGSYPTPLTNVDVNGRMMPASSYVQSANNVAITIPASATKSFSITLYNGMTPMIASTAFTCAEAAVVMPVEVVVPDPEITPTTTGGEMPQTATGNYNSLFTGVCLFALGGFGLLLRRRIKG